MYAPGDDSITFIQGPFGWRIPCFPPHDGYVYLICFNRAFKHARHYLGSAASLAHRIEQHRRGDGARLMEVISEAGITWEITRLWRCESPAAALELESRLKRWHHDGRLCPRCQGKRACPLASLFEGHWPFHVFSQAGKRIPIGEPGPCFVRLVR